jgi:hypothetical protein
MVGRKRSRLTVPARGQENRDAVGNGRVFSLPNGKSAAPTFSPGLSLFRNADERYPKRFFRRRPRFAPSGGTTFSELEKSYIRDGCGVAGGYAILKRISGFFQRRRASFRSNIVWLTAT